ncbi:MAG: peptide-N-glycosidase F-related protein [Phycisphaerales bacterium JB063]
MRAKSWWVALFALLSVCPVALAQPEAEASDGPARFNGTPVYVSGWVEASAGAPPTEAPPTVVPSGVTAEDIAAGVFDPGDTLELLMAWRHTHQTNTAVFGLWERGGYDSVDVRFLLRVGVGGLGGAVALLPTDGYGDTGPIEALPEGFSWDEPSLPGALAIGFDTHNPPSGNWFNAMGNIYDRPQREVSLHFDGVEVANVLSAVDFAVGIEGEEDADEGFHDVHLRIEHAVGGAYVTVWIDEEAVIDRRFVAGLLPYEHRLAFGASSSEFAAPFDVRAIGYEVGSPAGEQSPPTRATLIDRVVVHAGNREPMVQASLPSIVPAQTGRIIATLTLDPGPGGCDPWDKKGAVYVFNSAGERFELLRFITPYGRPYAWKVDVTDYAVLLSGEITAGLYVDTWMTGETPETTPGWTISVTLDYYAGTPEREVVAIENLWTGEPEYGNPAAPMQAFFVTKALTLPEGATGGFVRLMVTGHGMHPATYNAGEFMPADRTLVINDTHRHGNLLWREDCYLNPCRPQGGTWKFDRAGWAPGAMVEPWEVPLGDAFRAGREATLGYVPMAYENLAREEAQATHWVESQVFYTR